MKLITYYTDSHKRMLDEYFLPSLEKIKFNMEDLIMKNGNQYDSDGSYTHPKFNTITGDKLKFILNSLLMHEDEEFICFSDIDIQFFKSFIDDFNENYELYKQYDIIGQNDVPMRGQDGVFCTGFMYIKNTEQVHNFFRTLISNIQKFEHDQYCFNHYKHEIKTYLLDSNKYFNIALLNNCASWTPNQTNYKIPQDIIMHHANWTVGVENKLALLKFVKENVKTLD